VGWVFLGRDWKCVVEHDVVDVVFRIPRCNFSTVLTEHLRPSDIFRHKVYKHSSKGTLPSNYAPHTCLSFVDYLLSRLHFHTHIACTKEYKYQDPLRLHAFSLV